MGGKIHCRVSSPHCSPAYRDLQTLFFLTPNKDVVKAQKKQHSSGQQTFHRLSEKQSACTQTCSGSHSLENQRNINDFAQKQPGEGPQYYSLCSHENHQKACCYLIISSHTFKTRTHSSKFCICASKEHLPHFLILQFVQQQQRHDICYTGVHLLKSLKNRSTPSETSPW